MTRQNIWVNLSNNKTWIFLVGSKKHGRLSMIFGGFQMKKPINPVNKLPHKLNKERHSLPRRTSFKAMSQPLSWMEISLACAARVPFNLPRHHFMEVSNEFRVCETR